MTLKSFSMGQARTAVVLFGFAAVSACGAFPGATEVEERLYPQLPIAVVDLAAPYQNLAEADLNPADNCYWYRHYGVVETTWLPLRTPRGAHICQVATPEAT